MAHSGSLAISRREALMLYDAKSTDLGLISTSAQFERFRQVILHKCMNPRFPKFDLSENKLGPEAALSIAKILGRPKGHPFRVLDLSANAIKDKGACAIAKVLQNDEKMVKVDLSSNLITFVGSDAIFDAICNSVYVSELDIGGARNRNHLGWKGAEAVARCLEQNSVLYRLNISSTGIGSQGMEILKKGIAVSKALRVLDLSANSLGQEGISHLCETLEFSGIEELNLSRNAVTDAAVGVLCRALQYCRRLKRLELSQNQIGKAGCKFVAELLAKPLEEEEESDSEEEGDFLDTPVANQIATSFVATPYTPQVPLTPFTQFVLPPDEPETKIDPNERKDPKLCVLEYIGLSDNRIDNAGAILLGGALASNDSLVSLDLQHNQIGPEGGEAIGQALRSNDKLSKLNIAFNHIKDEGARSIAKALISNVKLLSLDLGCNRITAKGSKPLAVSLKSNNTIQSLSLNSNDIGDESGMSFVDAIHQSRNLTFLDLNLNKLSHHLFRKVEEAVQKNAQTYRKGATQRLKNEIVELKEDEQELIKSSKELEEGIKQRGKLESDLESAIQHLKILKVDEKSELKRMKTSLKEMVEERGVQDSTLSARGIEIQKFKAQFMNKVRMCQSREVRERELMKKVEKQYRRKKEEFDRIQRSLSEENQKLQEDLEGKKEARDMAFDTVCSLRTEIIDLQVESGLKTVEDKRLVELALKKRKDNLDSLGDQMFDIPSVVGAVSRVEDSKRPTTTPAKSVAVRKEP